MEDRALSSQSSAAVYLPLQTKEDNETTAETVRAKVTIFVPQSQIKS